MRSTLLLVALLGAAACAARSAAARGDRLASEARWAEAASAYELAADRRPGLPGLAERLANARAELVRAHHATADAARDAGDWRACLGALGHADAVLPGLPETRARAVACADLLVVEADAATASGDDELVYALATELARHIPDHPRAPELRAAARERALARAEALAALGGWPEAIDALGLIDRYEPDRRDPTEAARQGLRRRWADALRAQSEADARRGDTATAFVRQAQAAALSGLSTDRARRDALRRDVVDRWGLRVAVDGPRPGAAPPAEWRDALQRGFGATTPIGEAVEDPTVRWTIVAPPPRCASERVTVVGAVDVQRGREPYESPEWAAAHRAATELDDRVRVEERATGAAEAAITELRAAIAKDIEALRRAESALADAVAARDALFDTVAAASAAWSAAAQGFATGQDPDPERLEPARLAWTLADQALRKGEAAAAAARRQHAAAAERVRARTDDLARALADIDRQRARIVGLRSQAVDQRRAAEALPMILYRPVVETVRYPIARSTLRCTAAAEIREPDAPPRAVGGVATSVSESHPAVVEAGIDERPDPGRAAEDALRERAAARLIEDLAAAAADRARTWREAQLQLARQLARRRPDEALGRQIAVYLHGPDQPPEELRRALAEVFGIYDPTALLGR